VAVVAAAVVLLVGLVAWLAAVGGSSAQPLQVSPRGGSTAGAPRPGRIARRDVDADRQRGLGLAGRIECRHP
jgi:hypothetical protein